MKSDPLADVGRVIASDADPKVEFDIPEGSTVHFVGNPNLALGTSTNNLTLPQRFLRNPLIRHQYCFALPSALWDGLGRLFGESLDPETTELDASMSAICGDLSSTMGFKDGRAIACSLLGRPAQLPFPSAEEARAAGMDVNQAQLDHVQRTYAERIDSLTKVSRAYAGWLMTRPIFLDEHDALCEQWSPLICRWGLDRLGILMQRDGFVVGDNPNIDPQWAEYRSAFEAFFTRWRLQGLPVPYLPVPLQPLMSGQFPVSVLPQLMRAGGVFVLPDTFPIPSRDSLRGMLEDALHGDEPPDHLEEWMSIIASDNAAKKPLIRFARLLEVQHFYRVVHHRHGGALRRKSTRIQGLLASFLRVGPRTIHDDLQYVRAQLGANWLQRGNDFPFGPFSTVTA